MSHTSEIAAALGVAPDDLDEHGNVIPSSFRDMEAEFAETDASLTFELSQSAVHRTAAPASTDYQPRLASLPRHIPNSPPRRRWMGDFETVSNLTIAHAILPGSHNSGSDKEAPRRGTNSTCQDYSPYAQLARGIRVLDLRVHFYFGYRPTDPKRFQIVHGTASGRTVEDDILKAVNKFHSTAPREIVILDFHVLNRFTPEAHRELAELIHKHLGHKLVLPDMRELPIGQLWQLQKNVVIAYRSGERDPAFWNGVNQRWIGRHHPNDDDLARFIWDVGQENKGEHELRAVQAARYTRAMVPQPLEKQLNKWFAMNGSWGPIMHHRIINMDWATRSDVIENCIYANHYKGGLNSIRRRNPNGTYTKILTVGGVEHEAYSLFNGGWAPQVKIRDVNSSFTLHSIATWDSELEVGNGADGFSKVPVSDGDAMALIKRHDGRWHVVCANYTPNTHTHNIPPPLRSDKFCRYQMSDGNWRERIYLPVSTSLSLTLPSFGSVKVPGRLRNNHVILIANHATLDGVVDGARIQGGSDLRIKKGDNVAFVYKADQKHWVRLT